MPGGSLTASTPTSGALAFNDVDLTDTHKVSTALTGAVGLLDGVTLFDGVDNLPPGPLGLLKAALSASIASDSTGAGAGTIDWKFADLPVYIADFLTKGEILTLTYTVTLTDSQGATTSKDVTVTIAGTDQAAVVWIDTDPVPESGALWSDGANWETGTVPTANDDVIVITDQLHGLTPSFPVTIDAPAVAKSLTMNDFGTLPPRLINQSTLTIGGALNLGANSVVENFGSLSVGGLAEILDHSVLQNSGFITLGQGGDFTTSVAIANSGTIEVSGGMLNVWDVIDNAGGNVTVDSEGNLTLNGASVDCGTVTNQGEIDLTGAALLKNGSLGNSGTIYVSGRGNALHHENVTKNDLLDIRSGSVLTIDQGSRVENAGGQISIGGGGYSVGELTVNDATIGGGSVLNSGAVTLGGYGVLKNGSPYNFNYILVSGLGNALHNETVAVGGALQIVSGGVLTVDQGSTVSNPFSWEVVDGTLTLNAAVVDFGVVYNDPGGTIDLTGSAVIENGWLYNFGQLSASGSGNALHNETATNGAALEVLAGGVLIIDQGTSVANAGGTITVDANATLALDTATITSGTLSISGTLDATGNSTLTDVSITNYGLIEATSGVLTIDPAVLVSLTNSGTLKANGGELDITGEPVINTGTLQAIANSTLKLASLAVTNTGGTVTVGDGSTLDLTGVTINGGALGNSGRIDVAGPAMRWTR